MRSPPRAVQYRGTGISEKDNRISIEIPGVEDANAILEELDSRDHCISLSTKDADGNENYTLEQKRYVLNKTIDELKANGSIVLTGSEVNYGRRMGRSEDR